LIAKCKGRASDTLDSVLLLGVSSSHEEEGGEGDGEGEGERERAVGEVVEVVVEEVAAVVMALWFLNLKEVTMLVMIMLLDCHIRKSSAKLLSRQTAVLTYLEYSRCKTATTLLHL